MSKTLLMPIGYDTGGILRALSEHQLQSKDKFIFIIPATETNRTRTMMAEVEQTFSMLASRGIKLEHEFLKVDENDFTKIFSTLVGKIVEERGRQVIIEIAGGLRVICLALVLAAGALPDRVQQVYAIAESSSQRVAISLPLFQPRTSPSEIALLKELSQGLNTMDKLSRSLGKNKSTLNRQIRRLVDDGLVEQRREGRIIRYSLTLLGSVHLVNLGCLR